MLNCNCMNLAISNAYLILHVLFFRCSLLLSTCKLYFMLFKLTFWKTPTGVNKSVGYSVVKPNERFLHGSKVELTLQSVLVKAGVVLRWLRGYQTGTGEINERGMFGIGWTVSIISKRCGIAPIDKPRLRPWNNRHTAELKEASMGARKASAYLPLPEWLRSLARSLALLSLLKRTTCSVDASKYEIQFSFLKLCFP